MTTQDLITEQLARMVEMRKEFQNSRQTARELRDTGALRAERARTLRRTVRGLERQKDESTARFDAEIRRVRDDLAELEKPSDLDFLQRFGRLARSDKRDAQ